MQNEIANYSKSEAKRELARLSLLLKRANQAYHRDDDPIMSMAMIIPIPKWKLFTADNDYADDNDDADDKKEEVGHMLAAEELQPCCSWQRPLHQ